MSNTTRAKGTTFKRIVGLDNAGYSMKLGFACAAPAAPLLIAMIDKKVTPVVRGVVTATAITTAAVIADNNMKKYYSKTEYAIIFATASIGYTLLAHTAKKHITN